MAVRIELGFPPPDREALWWTVRALFGITIPRTRVCPDHCAPFDAFADAYFGECTVVDGQDVEPFPISRMIIHASRGLAGKSQSLSILGATFGYVLGADITILGGSMSQSANVHEYLSKAITYKNLPLDMIVDQTATKITWTNKGRVRPLPASQKNVRGPHPSYLLIDEVDEMELDIYDAALGQPMPQSNYLGQKLRTMTVVASTWQNSDGTLTEIFRRIADGEDKGTPTYKWCYKETSNSIDGWLSQETINEKRNSISAEMFRTEFDLQEPSIGNRAFDSDKVEEAFSRKFAPDGPVGAGDGYIEHEEKKDFAMYRFERYEKGATYVAGADWAKEKDFTVIAVARVDGPKRRIVYYLRVNRRPYPVMIGYFNKALRDYKISDSGAWHDSTGVGVAVDDYVDVRARPFSMTGEKRAKLLSSYVNAIEQGNWEIPRIPKMYSEMKFASVGDLYSGASGFHLPDTVAAGALAEHAAARVRPADIAPVSVPRDTAPSKLERQFSVQAEPERDALSPEASDTAVSFVVG